MSDIAFNDRLRRISLLAALAIPMVTACGGGSGGSAETPSTPPPQPAPTTTLSLLAGNTDGAGNQDGPTSTTARLSTGVGGMALTSAGEVVIADISNNRIRKLSANHEQLSTLAGSGVGVAPGSQSPNYADGDGSSARFDKPNAVAVDAAGNTYVADTWNHLVRKISASGTVTTLAGKVGVCGNQDGTGTAATLCRPTGVAVDKAGNVYVSEVKLEERSHSSLANPIRKITPAGQVSTLTSKASTYPSTVGISGPVTVDVYNPVHLAVDSNGTLHVADPNDHVIRKYAADGNATVLSGTVGPRNQGGTDGGAATAQFSELQAIAFDSSDRLFVLDRIEYQPAIRRIGTDGSVTTLVRAQSCSTHNAPGTLCTATQMVVKADGQFLVNEIGTRPFTVARYAQLRSYTQQGASTVVVGRPTAEGANDGQGSSARFDTPGSLAFNPAGALYVRDKGDNGYSTIRTVQADGLVRTLGKPDGHCTAVTGLSVEMLSNYYGPLATDGAGNLYSIAGQRVLKMRNCEVVVLADLTPFLNNPTSILWKSISSIAADSIGNVYVSTYDGAIFKIDTKGEVALFAGNAGATGHMDGQGTAARFAGLGNMATDAAGNIYVVDGLFYDNYRVGPTIRKITPSGLVSTLAGNPAAAPGYSDGSGTGAVFTADQTPIVSTDLRASIAADGKGNVYVSDPINHVIRKIAPDGRVTTPVGQAWRQGFAAGDLPGMISSPAGIAVRDSMMYITVPNAVLQVKLP